MKETVEFRINYNYAHLLFKADEGKDLGQLSKSIKIVELSKEDPRYNQIPIISNQVKEKYNERFFFGWQIKRKYSKNEIDTSSLFQMKIKTTFEPSGEECGTLYDETIACEICGANRKQISALKLKDGSIPKKDIAKTISGEIVVSEKFASVFKQKKLKGSLLEPITFGKRHCDYYQLIATNELDLSKKTIAGNDPFETTVGSKERSYNVSGYGAKIEKEVYKCPKGHTIGLNLLSEAFVLNNASITEFDFFVSKQKIGVKRGLLRPEPIYFCSPAFKKMVEEERLSGFDFEITNIL